MKVKHYLDYGTGEYLMMEVSDHKKLHNCLRKNGIQNASTKEIAKLSHRRHHIDDERCLEFYETVAPNVRLRERIGTYRGELYFTSDFKANNNKRIFNVQI